MILRLFIFSLLIISVCHAQDKGAASPFTINVNKLDIGRPFKECHLYNNDIICVLEDGKLAVFDSNYRHNATAEAKLEWADMRYGSMLFGNSDIIFLMADSNYDNKHIYVTDRNYNRKTVAETSLNSIKLRWAWPSLDTIWIADSNNFYSINAAYALSQPVDRKQFLRARPWLSMGNDYYSDAAYIVTWCCAAEFGGNIFFFNRANGKAYYYPLSCTQQVTKRNGYYYVTENLDRLLGATSYLTIKDPSRLFELSTQAMADVSLEKSFCCNCYPQNKVDYYMARDARIKRNTERGVEVYYDTGSRTTIGSFETGNDLYSIQAMARTYNMVQHKGKGIELIDTIERNKIQSRKAAALKQPVGTGRKLFTYNHVSYDGESADETQRIRSAIIIVNGYAIDILEYNEDKKVKRE